MELSELSDRALLTWYTKVCMLLSTNEKVREHRAGVQLHVKSWLEEEISRRGLNV